MPLATLGTVGCPVCLGLRVALSFPTPYQAATNDDSPNPFWGPSSLLIVSPAPALWQGGRLACLGGVPGHFLGGGSVQHLPLPLGIMETPPSSCWTAATCTQLRARRSPSCLSIFLPYLQQPPGHPSPRPPLCQGHCLCLSLPFFPLVWPLPDRSHLPCQSPLQLRLDDAKCSPGRATWVQGGMG